MLSITITQSVIRVSAGAQYRSVSVGSQTHPFELKVTWKNTDVENEPTTVNCARTTIGKKKKGLCSGFIFNFHHDKHTLPALKLCIDVRCGPFHSDQGALLLSCCDHSGIVSNVHSLPSLSPTITFTKYIEFTGLKIYRSEPS